MEPPQTERATLFLNLNSAQWWLLRHLVVHVDNHFDDGVASLRNKTQAVSKGFSDFFPALGLLEQLDGCVPFMVISSLFSFFFSCHAHI